MAREVWEVWRDGRRETAEVDIEVVADLTEPCRWCGAHCTGRYRFWSIRDDVFRSVDINRDEVDELVRRAVGAAVSDEYRRWPSVLRDVNEATGWCAADAPFTGTAVGVDEFERAVAILRSLPALALSEGFLDALELLVSDARADGSAVWVLDD